MTDRVVISDCQSGYEYLSVGLCVCLARRISAEFGSRVPNLYACRLTVKLSSSSRVVSGRRSFLGIESASSCAQISLERRIRYPPNINWPFLMVRTERLLRLTSKKQDVLPYPGLQKYAYLRWPVYARRIPATFGTPAGPALCNGSKCHVSSKFLLPEYPPDFQPNSLLISRTGHSVYPLHFHLVVRVRASKSCNTSSVFEVTTSNGTIRTAKQLRDETCDCICIQR